MDKVVAVCEEYIGLIQVAQTNADTIVVCIQVEFLGQMECNFHVYDMDSPALKILCLTRSTLQAASLSSILKNYGTLMKLWGYV